MEESGPSIDDYLDIVWRRKMLAIFTVPVLLLISVAITMSLPPIFMSEGTILIQDQEIPEELVKSTVTSYAEQQIETTRQRIMTSAKIMEMIDKHQLYMDKRANTGASQLSQIFRDSMNVQMIEAEVPGQWGQVSRTSIAFIVSFMDRDPEIAQRVTNELTTLFLEDNVKSRTGKADETAQFLKEEADRMQARVQETENRIAEFKLEYGDSLPELLQFNLSTVERLEEQSIDVQDEMLRLKDRIDDMNAELANISPFVTYSSDSSGGSITPRQRLMELKEEYSRLIIGYAESHPDIVRLKEEIAVAENQITVAPTEVSNDEALNPQYRQMRNRIEAAEKELIRLQERRQKMEEDHAEYQQRVARTHQVKRNYDELTRDYTNKLEKYQELRSKQLEANIAQNMEAENKAGSFKLIEPPVVAEKPVKPNRKKLLALGFMLSFGAGVGLMLAAEMLDSGVRGVSNVHRILGQAPLVVVNHIYNADDFQVRDKNRKKLFFIFLGFTVVGIIVFHFFIMGLDVFVAKVLAKLSVM